MEMASGVSTTNSEPMIATMEQIFRAAAWLMYLGMKIIPQI